jgi:hypothetical protein
MTQPGCRKLAEVHHQFGAPVNSRACRLHNAGQARDYQRMSSPTDQLIRDYLNRLSGAARGQLGAGDRRALVDRTREFIERKTGTGRPTALEVGRLLFGLGDPVGLVSQERERLANLRGEPPEPVSQGRLVRVLRGERSKVRGASWHWPVQPGSRTGVQFTLSDGGGPAGGREATAGAATGGEAGRPVAAEVSGQLVPNRAPHADPAAARPVRPTLAAGTAEAEAIDREAAERETSQHEIVDGEILDGEIVDGDDGERGAREPDADHQALDHQALDHQARDHQARGPDGPAVAPGTRPSGLAGMNWQLVTAAPQRPSRSRELLAGAGGWSRHHKLETVAIALLGLGGAIFPPVWLLGAVVALASGLWSYRDKWVGLALPILVTVVGTAAGISVGGRVSFGHSMHEGWVFAVDVSRAMAVLSACYLGWRAARGPRPPVPPWDRRRTG